MELYDHFEGWVQNYCNSFTNVKRWQWFCTKPSIYNLTFCIILFLHIICHFVLFCMYVLFYVVTCPYGPWLIQINLKKKKPHRVVVPYTHSLIVNYLIVELKKNACGLKLFLANLKFHRKIKHNKAMRALINAPSSTVLLLYIYKYQRPFCKYLSYVSLYNYLQLPLSVL